MKRLLILFLLLGSATPVNAFWGSTEEEKDICRNRARGERNEFSAKQTYKVCLKNLKKERETKAKAEKLILKKENEFKKLCKNLYQKSKGWKAQKSLERNALLAYEKAYYALPLEDQKDDYFDTSRGYTLGFISHYKNKYAPIKLLSETPSFQKYKKKGCTKYLWD